MNNLVSRQYLALIASRFLDFLDFKNVKKVSDFNTCLINKYSINNFSINDGLSNYLIIQITPSNKRTQALTMDYIENGSKGIVLSIKINSALNYSKINLKCDSSVKSYETYSADIFGNKINIKTLKGTNILNLKDELEQLIT